ncbi:MAG: CHAT domain-containing protein, partial [Haliscomenobacter sp.]|nr:CHAT domain-containing protein [Haliscomenobacter sp.]
MKPIPIFFFAFANEEGRFLELLKQESSAVYNALYPVEEQGRLLIAREESLSSDELFLAFRRYKDRMFIFHFAGHAGSDVLGLEDLEANASHVADLLAEQKDSLKLVFLNGCATLNQVARLQELGIKAVIATSRPVEDDKAQFFAEEFYKNLATGNFTLKESFLQAKTA